MKTRSGLSTSALHIAPIEQVALAEWQKHAQKGAAYEDQGEDLKWAACEAYTSAFETGASHRNIAEETGKSPSHVVFMMKALFTKVNDPQPGLEFADYYAMAKGKQPHNTQSNSNEWYTPARYIDSVRRVMGTISLDPSSCEMANATVGAEIYFDQDADGLQQAWFGKVFMNPPWGDAGPAFTAKLLDEFGQGRVKEATVLVNAHSTETNWFHPYYDHTLCFTDHRIDYDSPSGKSSTSTHGSVFIYMGPSDAAFAKEFQQWGTVVRRWS